MTNTASSSLSRKRRLWSLLIAGVALIGIATISFSAYRSYRVNPPVPKTVYDALGLRLFSGDDIMAGRQILLDNGIISGFSILGMPQFSCSDPIAFYLPKITDVHCEKFSRIKGRPFAQLSDDDRLEIESTIPGLLRHNTYDSFDDKIIFMPYHTEVLLTEAQSLWHDFFSDPSNLSTPVPDFVADPAKLRLVADYLAWLSWAAITDRPDLTYSYTNNAPAFQVVGNNPVDLTGLWLGYAVFGVLFVIGIVGFFRTR